MLILGIIFAIAAVALFLVGLKAKFTKRIREGYDLKTVDNRTPNAILKGSSALVAILAVVFIFFSMFYTQDVGEAKVMKSWTGEIVGEDLTAGAGLKAPWVEAIDFDIRNQQATYIGDGSTDHNGGVANGPEISVQDKEGVRAAFDIAVRYSIKPDAVTAIYSEYQSQANFEARLIDQDIRSVVRNAPSDYGTLEVLTKRGEIEENIFEALKQRWEGKGVTVESVALQEIRYPKDVMQKFADAQNARTEIVKAEAELEAAEVSSQQKIVQSKAEAKANEILTKSLTDEVLRQRYLDTLAKLAEAGNLVITDGSSNQIINLPKK